MGILFSTPPLMEMPRPPASPDLLTTTSLRPGGTSLVVVVSDTVMRGHYPPGDGDVGVPLRGDHVDVVVQGDAEVRPVQRDAALVPVRLDEQVQHARLGAPGRQGQLVVDHVAAARCSLHHPTP